MKDKIKKAKKKLGGDVKLPKKKPLTSAEKTKTYRERKVSKAVSRQVAQPGGASMKLKPKPKQADAETDADVHKEPEDSSPSKHTEMAVECEPRGVKR